MIPCVLSESLLLLMIGTAHVLIQACVLLRNGIKPDDLASGEAHYQIDMSGTLRKIVHIVAETVRLGEQNLRQMVGLRLSAGSRNSIVDIALFVQRINLSTEMPY